MRIAMVAPPWISVPPKGYGGIELVVHLLAEELISRGHDVTLFATGDSEFSGELRYVFDVGQSARLHHALPYAMHIGSAFAAIRAEAVAGRPYDLVHDHTQWVGLAFASLLDMPVVHTLHGAAFDNEKAFYRLVRDNARFVAISRYQTTSFTEIDITAVVPNAVNVDEYPLRIEKEDYLLCLGRISRDKNQGAAIEVAKRLDIPIVLAGKIDPGPSADYFEEAVRPHIDGQLVRFEGEVPAHRKRELFAGARAMLFPIRWHEPFGLVMIEAMACGTPVIATPYGAVPEVVVDGVTGFIVEDVDQMTKAVERTADIDPHACRRHVSDTFSPVAMTDGYERVYEKVARAR